MKSQYKDLIDYFDKIASDFRTDPGEVQRAEYIFEMLKPTRTKVAIDIGCGNGFLLPILRRCAETVVGVDISRGMLKLAKINGIVINSNAEALPIKDESVGIILNYCVLPHIRDRIAAYREYHRVLCPGGVVYIIHPEGRERTNEIHKEIGSPVKNDLLPAGSILMKELSDIGFKIVSHVDSINLFLIAAMKSI